MQIELIERPFPGPCLARIFGKRGRLVFVSNPHEGREQPIEEAEAWAIENLGQELPVSLDIELLEHSRCVSPVRTRTARSAHDPAYGISEPLPTKHDWTLNE